RVIHRRGPHQKLGISLQLAALDHLRDDLHVNRIVRAGIRVTARVADDRTLRIGADPPAVLLAAPEQAWVGVRLELRRPDYMDALFTYIRIKAPDFRAHQLAPDQKVIEPGRDPPLARQVVPGKDKGRRRDARRP